MTRKSSSDISSDAYLEWLTTLLANGYNDEVKAFTRSIQTNHDAVLDFEIAFDMLVCFALQPDSRMEGCWGEVHLTAICH